MVLRESNEYDILRIKKDTKMKIHDLKPLGETYDGILNKLIDSAGESLKNTNNLLKEKKGNGFFGK